MVEDEASFEEWYRSTHRRLVNALVVASSDVELAIEATDEAFPRCLERWGGPDHPDDPSAWTYRAAVNELSRRWRRSKRESDLLRLVPPSLPVEIPEPAIELWKAVAGLSDRMRLAVVLRYVAGLTEAEVADAMDIAPGTVAATLSKARRHLAADLQSKEDIDV